MKICYTRNGTAQSVTTSVLASSSTNTTATARANLANYCLTARSSTARTVRPNFRFGAETFNPNNMQNM
jgi:hypothetical protein